MPPPSIHALCASRKSAALSSSLRFSIAISPRCHSSHPEKEARTNIPRHAMPKSLRWRETEKRNARTPREVRHRRVASARRDFVFEVIAILRRSLL